MAITIHISCIPSGSEDMIDNFNLQMDDSYGPADNVICKAEDEDDEDSLWDCYYHYANLSFDDVDWDSCHLRPCSVCIARVRVLLLSQHERYENQMGILPLSNYFSVSLGQLCDK